MPTDQCSPSLQKEHQDQTHHHHRGPESTGRKLPFSPNFVGPPFITSYIPPYFPLPQEKKNTVFRVWHIWMVPSYSFHRKDARVRDSYFGWPGVSNKHQEGESYRSLCTSLEAIFYKTMKSCTSLSTRLEWSPLICSQASHPGPSGHELLSQFQDAPAQHLDSTALTSCPWNRSALSVSVPDRKQYSI